MSDAKPLSEVLMTAVDEMAPVFEAAEGMRADLERRGWSPTMAEQIAGTWLLGAMGAAWGRRS